MEKLVPSVMFRGKGGVTFLASSFLYSDVCFMFLYPFCYVNKAVS